MAQACSGTSRAYRGCTHRGVEFLARGEYSLNYLVRGDPDLVARLVAALVVLPVVPLVLWAFAGEWRFPDLLPTAWSLRGMGHLVEPGGGVLGATLNSLVIGAASVAVGLPAGMAIGGYEWRLKDLWSSSFCSRSWCPRWPLRWASTTPLSGLGWRTRASASFSFTWYPRCRTPP